MKSLKKLSSYCVAATLLSSVFCAATPTQKTFEPTWESLKANYEYPEWFRDAKFGIWAHWSAQCVPEQGDWYAHEMYNPEHRDYKYQIEHYGHPSEFGFKDIDHVWHAEHWEPEKLLELYKRAGAKYFVALANHHDNFDNWNSKYQEWNSVRVGPQKDLVGGWAAAARKAGLRFGVSVHAAFSWSWFEITRNSDLTGPKAGVPYDGVLTAADGKGKWWDGLDPSKLYNPHKNGEPPSQEYLNRFYLRTKDLIDQHHPDFVYFDDTVLPLEKNSDVGLRLASYFYNANQEWHGGKQEAVMTTKRLDLEQRRALTMDIECSVAERLEPLPWESGTCIGYWHYQRDLFEKHGYKSARQVIRMLAEVVSKNGNLLLSVPLRGDGTIDDDERQTLESIAAWMAVNSECIYSTRPWRVYGEGPSTLEKLEITRFGAAAEARMAKPYTPEDFRFTTKGNILYAIALEWPESGKLRIRSLSKASADREIKSVQLLGGPASLKWTQTADGLEVELPSARPCDHAYALKIE